MLSSRDMNFCFQGGIQRIRSRTVLIAALALTLFHAPWSSPVFNTPQFHITFNCPMDEISRYLQWFQEFENLRIWFSTFVKDSHSHTVFLDTPLHINTARDTSKLPWHSTWRDNSPKIINLWNFPPHCFQLRTTRNLGQNLWQIYVCVYIYIYIFTFISLLPLYIHSHWLGEQFCKLSSYVLYILSLQWIFQKENSNSVPSTLTQNCPQH